MNNTGKQHEPHHAGPITSEQWAHRLVALGDAVVAAVTQARDAGADLATPVAEEGGDTIFAIDRHVEAVLEAQIEAWELHGQTLTLIAEGMGADGVRKFGTARASRGWKLIVDPIDGTRNIMYDKRSAWFLAALVPDAADHVSLKDAIASAAIELPTSKQGWRDRFAGWRDALASNWRLHADRCPVGHHGWSGGKMLQVQPSRATTLLQGFAQVTNFFPGTKVLASTLMERIVHATLGEVAPGSAAVFDDQYISTGGQFVELMMGRDRFCCDLRPLFYRILEKESGRTVRGLECHPYDVAAAPLAQAAGVVLTDGFGQPLDAPLDVFSPVHWCGYANETLRRQIEPVIQSFLREHGVESACTH